MPNLRVVPWLAPLLPLFFIAYLLATLRIVHRLRPGLIHAHWVFPQGLLALLASTIISTRTPVVVTAHGGDIYTLRRTPLRSVLRVVLRKAAAVTVVSHALAEEVKAITHNRINPRVASMGADLHQLFTPDPVVGESERLLFVGRLAAKKGLCHLLDALALLHRQGMNLHLDVVGDGPLRTELERQSHETGIGHLVHFHGGIHHPWLPVFYRRANLFVFPSVITPRGDQEGLGLTAVEAMGCGCAVIASDLPGVRDVVQHEVTGWLIPPGDSTALATAIAVLVQRPRLCRSLAQAGRHYAVQQFDWQTVGARYTECYLGALKQAPSTSPGTGASRRAA